LPARRLPCSTRVILFFGWADILPFCYEFERQIITHLGEKAIKTYIWLQRNIGNSEHFIMSSERRNSGECPDRSPQAKHK
jgi:hypothetical protein